jgi:hypothetical protein
MRINKEEARLLATFISENLQSCIDDIQQGEQRKQVAQGTTKAMLEGMAAICEAMHQYGEDRRGNGRWNPNTDDMGLKELAKRVYNRRAENLQGHEREYGIYYELEPTTLTKS